MYKIILDESKIFECNISIEGSSIDKSKVRLILESENYNLIFNGNIGYDGKARIPISRLKGLLKENSTGKLTLEVIADDTLFIPWTSEYTCEVKKKVEVNFSDKPIISEVKVSFDEPIKDLAKLLVSEGITLQNVAKNRNKVKKLITEHIAKNKSNSNFKEIIERLPVELYKIESLSKK